ncbi:hypothetical protein [Novosphingobium naphthalenivorans]|uniref:hypothetical protein n=1 Tax=Novosphingobium naphthalenivorans TaxID=273168 RepID=UPI000A83C687|nr:hypothetical protein [Novosphingobium naphthalenivorans]
MQNENWTSRLWRKIDRRPPWRNPAQIGQNADQAIHPAALPSDRMGELQTQRDVLREQITTSAHSGLVPDALALSLYENCLDQAGEWKRLLAEEELALGGCLRGLGAMFPAPAPPEPEPPVKPRPRNYQRIGKLFGDGRGRKPH